MKRGLLLILFLVIMIPNVYSNSVANSCMNITFPGNSIEKKDFTINVTTSFPDYQLVMICSMQNGTLANNLTLQRNVRWNVSMNDYIYFDFNAPYNELSSKVYISCITSNDRLFPLVNSSCYLDTSNSMTNVVNNGIQLPIPNNMNRVKINGTKFYVDGKETYFNGVNVHSLWKDWNYSTIDSEFQKMDNAGINAVRIIIFWEDMQYQNGTLNSTLSNHLIYFIKKASEHDIFITLIPYGGWRTKWLFPYFNNSWFENNTIKNLTYDYGYKFGKLLYDNNIDNIIYISMMPEASYDDDWFDPLSAAPNMRNVISRGYPGQGSLNEAEKDWQKWLVSVNKPISSLNMYAPEMTNIYDYITWDNLRFRNTIRLRSNAVREGSNYAYYTGAEGGQGGHQYDYNAEFLPVVNFLNPEVWMDSVDVAEIHNYVPSAQSFYYSYWGGISTYLDKGRDFNKPVFNGEGSYDYPIYINMDNINNWQKLSDKLSYAKTSGLAGFLIWSWADYRIDRDYGFEDINLNPKPILNNYIQWNYENINTSISIPLAKGVNFISIPFYIKDKDPRIVFNSNIMYIISFDNNFWNQNLDFNNINNYKQLENQKGYVIITKNPTSITFKGLSKPYKNSRSLKNLDRGWNLIGILGNDQITANYLRNNTNISEVWTYNSGIYSQLNDNSILVPGRSYWVFNQQ